MNTDRLKEIGKMLNATDKQEQQTRKAVMSRRWFVRSLAVTAMAITAASLQNARAQVQPDSVCQHANTGGCNPSNSCQDGNSCSGTTSNNCKVNQCMTNNTCGCSFGTSGNSANNTCSSRMSANQIIAVQTTPAQH